MDILWRIYAIVCIISRVAPEGNDMVDSDM